METTILISFLGSLGFGLDVVGLYIILYGGEFLDELESCKENKNEYTFLCLGRLHEIRFARHVGFCLYAFLSSFSVPVEPYPPNKSILTMYVPWINLRNENGLHNQAWPSILTHGLVDRHHHCRIKPSTLHEQRGT